MHTGGHLITDIIACLVMFDRLCESDTCSEVESLRQITCANYETVEQLMVYTSVYIAENNPFYIIFKESEDGAMSALNRSILKKPRAHSNSDDLSLFHLRYLT